MKYKPLTVKQFSPSLFSLKGISKRTMDEHLKLYQGYVNKYNEINEALNSLSEEDYAKANQVYSHIRELKVELSFAWGGVVNHELYFSILDKGTISPSGAVHTTSSNNEPKKDVMKQIDNDFGSFDAYKKDLKASAISARGWVWTGWNTQEKRLFNYVGDSQNTYLAWNVQPILALDTYEHAYFIDFGVNRGAYIDVFLDNVNWEYVNSLYKV